MASHPHTPAHRSAPSRLRGVGVPQVSSPCDLGDASYATANAGDALARTSPVAGDCLPTDADFPVSMCWEAGRVPARPTSILSVAPDQFQILSNVRSASFVVTQP